MIREQNYPVSPESGMYLMYVSVMRKSVAASFCTLPVLLLNEAITAQIGIESASMQCEG